MTPLLLSIVLLIGVGCRANDNKAAFEEFLKTYNLTYDDAEYNRRFGIFTANIKRIENAKNAGDKAVGINRFADTDPEEFQHLLMPMDFEEKAKGKNRTGRGQPPAENNRAKRQTPPSTYDMRSYGWVTPVKNQGQCGSCWAFAAIAGYEVVCRRSKFQTWTPDMSEQQLVDCEPYGYGCGGGWTDYALDYIQAEGKYFAKNRIAEEAKYPYAAYDQTCKAASIYHPNKGIAYHYLTSESDIAWHVYTTGPVAFYFRVPSSFQYHTGGVFDPADCSTNIIGYHEMLIVGYTSSYWIVKNSWGTGFGNAGYVYYARGKNLCGMANELIAIKNY
ncbi:cathepsin L-like protein [Aphelenchoides avenae]|nr:cathepsin L-like protein [Aphelenchus avenae]